MPLAITRVHVFDRHYGAARAGGDGGRLVGAAIVENDQLINKRRSLDELVKDR